MAQDPFKIFFDDTMAAAGFKNSPEDFKKAYRERLELAFAKRLGVDALAMLDAGGLADFKNFTEQNPNATPQTIFEFFKDHIPDLENKMISIMREFQQEFIKAAKAVAV